MSDRHAPEFLIGMGRRMQAGKTTALLFLRRPLREAPLPSPRNKRLKWLWCA